MSGQFLHDRRQLGRPQRTVHAQSRQAQPLESHDHGFHGRAEKRASIRLKAHGQKHRLVAVFQRRQRGGLRFQQIGEGFEQDAVAQFRAGAHLTGHRFVNLVEIGVADGSHGTPRRTDVEQDPFAGKSVRGTARDLRGRLDDLSRFIARSPELVRIGAERVGLHEIAAGYEVLAMDRLDQLRPDHVQAFGNLAELQAFFLKHRAHGAVEHDDTVKSFHHGRNRPFFCIGRPQRSSRRSCAAAVPVRWKSRSAPSPT